MDRFTPYSQYEKKMNESNEVTNEGVTNTEYDDETVMQYEAYKLQALSDLGYTLGEVFGLVIQYALDNGQLDLLTEDPECVLSDWECEEASELFLSYDEWLEANMDYEDEEDDEDEYEIPEEPCTVDRHELYHMEWADYESDNPFFAY